MNGIFYFLTQVEVEGTARIHSKERQSETYGVTRFKAELDDTILIGIRGKLHGRRIRLHHHSPVLMKRA